MRNCCSQQPRCVKCGKDHLTEKCSKDPNLPARCTLCSGAHTASYKSCTIYKKLREKLTDSTKKSKKGKIPNTTRHHVTNTTPSSPTF